MFAVLFSSQLITLLGSELTRFAIPIWLYAQTGSAVSVTLGFATAFIPRIFFGPFVGTLVDHYGKKRLLIFSELGQAICLLVLFYLVGNPGPEMKFQGMIFAVLGLQSFFSLFQHPGIVALTPELVSASNLQKANALLSMADSITLTLGPILAGFLLEMFTLDKVLLVDFFSFIFSSLLLIFLPHDSAQGPLTVRAVVGKTFSTAREMIVRPGLLQFLLLGTGLNFAFSLSFGLLNPYLQLLYKGQSFWVGITNGVGGGFEILGSAVIALLPPVKRRVRFQLFCMLGMSAFGATLMGLAPQAFLVSLGLGLMLFFMALINSVNRTAWQKAIDPKDIGSFFAIKRMVSHSVAPLGFFLSGYIYDSIFRDILGLNELTSFRCMFLLTALIILLISFSSFGRAWIEGWDGKQD